MKCYIIITCTTIHKITIVFFVFNWYISIDDQTQVIITGIMLAPWATWVMWCDGRRVQTFVDLLQIRQTFDV